MSGRGPVRTTFRVLVSLGLLVCAPTWAGTLQSNAACRARVELPADAAVDAELQDMSKADAAAAVLGGGKLDPAGCMPSRLEIAHDDAALRAGRRRTVGNESRPGATVDDIGDLPASFEGELPGAGNSIVWHVDLLPEGRYRLRTTHVGKPEPNSFDDIGRWARDESGRVVLRGGREAPVFLLPLEGGAALRKLDVHGRPIESSHNDLLLRLPEPGLIEPRLFLTGTFTYLADAASITLCADGQRLPVGMEGDYRALEAAYLEARSQPGQPLLANLEGLIARRPSMEEGRPPQTTLVVERFIAVWPRESCGNTLADSPLCGTYWKLVRLGGTPVSAAANRSEAHLLFAADVMRVAGSGGCNRLIGGFELEGDRLRFGRMASTKMFCPDGMDQERRFLQELQRVERYRIRGSHLDLLDGAGTVRARLEAVALH